jgi:hypothetical protein
MKDERPHRSLPPITPLADTDAQLIRVGPHPDWLIGSNGSVWVNGVDDGVAVFDAETARRVGSIAIEGELCGAPDVGFGAVWFPTCKPAAIHRVSVETFELTASISVDLPSRGEFTIGAGAGGVWAILEERGGPGRLAGIDPSADHVAALFEIPSGAVSVRAGTHDLWVAYPGGSVVRRIDPSTGRISAEFRTGAGPRFLVIGEDDVWVFNQTSGSVTRIVPAANVAATIEIDESPMRGGDIALGHGSVWVRGTKELVAQIDPVTENVIARFGEPSVGSASVAVADSHLWISAGAERHLYRMPL